MTDRVKALFELLKSKEYKKGRRHVENTDSLNPEGVVDYAALFKRVLAEEHPIIHKNDRLGFHFSTDRKIHWLSGNVSPNYSRIITDGFDKTAQTIERSIRSCSDKERIAYGKQMLKSLDYALEYAEKYREEAAKTGNTELAAALSKIPHSGAETFYEACVFLKLSLFFLRATYTDHVTLGRFDQYMYPFYLHDKKNGTDDETIFEMIEEFFISLNFDADLYPGVQMGDNGQSMVLGGYDVDGKSMYNELSKMCLDASLELSLIDPKINLRVNKSTPLELFESATYLTKKGLGFPQYCNDDIVVDGLVKLGYAKEDALDYVVAACWEFIIPGKGADVPNLNSFCFPAVINEVITKELDKCDTFEELLERVRAAIAANCEAIRDCHLGKPLPRHPFASVYFDGCIEKLQDVFCGGTKYNNYGCHGTGIANAADALAAVKKVIYDDKSMSKEVLLNALKADFNGYSEERNMLKACPKMGNNDDYVDSLATYIMRAFSDNMNGKPNGIGGIWRAGTGSAQCYLRDTDCTTADGRKSGTPYPSSFSPSLDVKTDGLLSVLQSFTKFDLTDIINGGPLTIEIHDTVLRNDVGIKKVAMLVQKYIELGGHQLQLNSVNRDRLIDAQRHPEKYPNLIVRVWGWSGYFNELDKSFQDHIIRRTEYGA